MGINFVCPASSQLGGSYADYFLWPKLGRCQPPFFGFSELLGVTPTSAPFGLSWFGLSRRGTTGTSSLNSTCGAADCSRQLTVALAQTLSVPPSFRSTVMVSSSSPAGFSFSLFSG